MTKHHEWLQAKNYWFVPVVAATTGELHPETLRLLYDSGNGSPYHDARRELYCDCPYRRDTASLSRRSVVAAWPRDGTAPAHAGHSDGFCGWCWHHCSFGVVPPGGASAGGPCSNPPPPSVRDSDAAESFWRASRLQSKGIEAGTLAIMNDVQVDL